MSWKISTTENKRSSIWQLCRHWWHRKLSLRQLTVPPVTTKLSNWRPFVFSDMRNWIWMAEASESTLHHHLDAPYLSFSPKAPLADVFTFGLRQWVIGSWSPRNCLISFVTFNSSDSRWLTFHCICFRMENIPCDILDENMPHSHNSAINCDDRY